MGKVGGKGKKREIELQSNGKFQTQNQYTWI